MGFGFGVGGGEFGGVAKEGEDICGRILQAVQYFQISFWEKRTRFPKMGITSFACLQPPYFPIHQPTIPETLPEVPAEAGKTVKEAELEEVADAEVGKCAEIGRELVIFDFLLVCCAWIFQPFGIVE